MFLLFEPLVRFHILFQFGLLRSRLLGNNCSFDHVQEYVLDVDFVDFSKLQCNGLAFVAGFKRATDEGSLPEIVQYSPY